MNERLPQESPEWSFCSEEELRERLGRLKEKPAVVALLSLLKERLPERYPDLARENPDVLDYHGAPHSDDVLREAVLLSSYYGDRLSDREQELLAVAAAGHDAGFTERYENNEEAGADITTEAMRAAGSYSDEEVERVRKAIRGTAAAIRDGKFVQSVEGDDLIGRVLADADVANFGRDDFFEKGEAIFRELVSVGKRNNTAEARLNSKKFGLFLLGTHEWQSEAGKKLHDEKQAENLRRLEKELSGGTVGKAAA